MMEVLFALFCLLAIIFGLLACLLIGVGIGVTWLSLMRRVRGGTGRQKPRRRYGFRANFAHRWAQWN